MNPIIASAHFVDIAVSEPESPRNDTADVAELPDGRLMVAWHRFRRGDRGTTDFGCADIATRYSHNGGYSWSAFRIVAECAPGDINIQAPALCVLPSGELLMTALRAHNESSSSMVLFRSVDGGTNWREVSQIWSQSTGQWLQGGTASLLLLRSGRLLLPFHGGSGSQGHQHNVASCFVSDDEGYTWRQTAAQVDLPLRGAMEASVAQLSDGRLLMAASSTSRRITTSAAARRSRWRFRAITVAPSRNSGTSRTTWIAPTPISTAPFSKMGLP